MALDTLGDLAEPTKPASAASPEARPQAGWITRVRYDPDHGNRAADFQVPASEYLKRFAVLEADRAPTGRKAERYRVRLPGLSTDQAYLPMEVRGSFLEPVLDGRRLVRWRPRVIESKAELRAFHGSPEGQWKLLRESEFDDSFRGRSGTDALGLMDQEFIPLTAGPFNKQLTFYDYLAMHGRAFELTNHNAIAAAAIKIMTRFTLGRGISFHIKNDSARQVWSQFWERNNMRVKIRQMARDLPWQGELMLRYYEHTHGRLDVRVMDPSTVWEIVTDPDDIEHTYYYHQMYQCLRGDTRIACLDGSEPTIAELSTRNATTENPIWVYSYDEATGRVVPGKATKCWKQGRKRCVEVVLDNEEVIVASWDHPFLLRTGQYVQAEKLRPGDSLMPLYRRAGYERVWHPGSSRWEPTHQMVARETCGPPPEEMVRPDVHHLNDRTDDNRPDNLAYMPHAVHVAEAIRRHWSKPENAGLLALSHARTGAGVKQGWARGAYAHLPKKGERPAAWSANIARGVKASWADPEIRARRVQAMRESPRRAERRRKISAKVADRTRDAQGRFTFPSAPENHKVVAVRPIGHHVVYDLTVERYHNFALAAGVFTHNTPTQIWVTGRIPTSRYIVAQVPPTNVQHMKINCSATEKRGRSDLLPAMSWFKRLNDYYNGVTVKALLEANLVWKVKVQGDPRDVQNLSTDPAIAELPPPGGIWWENDQVNLQAVSATLTASRASSGIGGELIRMIAASMNLPDQYFNVDSGGGTARATALVRTDPAVKTIEDRQQLLREVLEEMYEREMATARARGRISAAAAREEPAAGPDEDMVPDRRRDPEDWAADQHAQRIQRAVLVRS